LSLDAIPLYCTSDPKDSRAGRRTSLRASHWPHFVVAEI
jgi:hypothetical protein